MKHPPYHLRVNKAVDRLAFFDVIKRVERMSLGLPEYTYYSLGGPYLEDFRTLYEICPEIGMVSIENDNDTYERQKFHLPCGKLKLVYKELSEFIDYYTPGKERSVFWLDYVDLEYEHFDDLATLLPKLAEFSIVKITFPADPKDYIDSKKETPGTRWAAFTETFEQFLPTPLPTFKRNRRKFAEIIQNMLRLAVDRTFFYGSGYVFQPVSSFRYADGKPMYTLTGFVCSDKQKHRIISAYEDWDFANLDWSEPIEIDIPHLSTKERLHLQEHLPCFKRSGIYLRKILRYNVGDGLKDSRNKLKSYAEFHRYSPYFVKALP